MKLLIPNQNGFTLIELLLVIILIEAVALLSVHNWVL